MQLDEYRHLQIEIDGYVATIRLNRPEHLNAVNSELHAELETIWDDIGHMDDLRCIVLTGAGRAFSAGGDLRAMVSGEYGDNPAATLMPGARKMIYSLLAVRPPVVAAVNGDCVGLGASLALLSDYVVMAEDAHIGDPHVRVGLVAGDGGVPMWPLIVGMARAKEALLLGKLYTGREALAMGLINDALPAEEVLPAAFKIAQQLASSPPLAIQWTKHSLNKLVRQAVETSFDTALALEMITFVSQDHKRAARGFIEKTKPEFEGN
ncbi:MAG: enoyl-CoA hydratase-related protein [Dehalococcoidia bacterium]